jgi:molecular chaperone HscB
MVLPTFVQRIAAMNYFELFDIPAALRVDKAAIRQKYLALSRRLHPDHNTSGDEAAQDKVLEDAANLNRAYKTLTNEDDLIAYVLRQKGLLADGEKYSLPPDFLMEMMELNETLEEATDASAKATILRELKEKKEAIYAPVKTVIETYSESATTEEALLQVKEYFFKKKYLHRLEQQLEQLL